MESRQTSWTILSSQVKMEENPAYETDDLDPIYERIEDPDPEDNRNRLRICYPHRIVSKINYCGGRMQKNRVGKVSILYYRIMVE